MIFTTGTLILAAGVFLGFFTQTIVGFASALVGFPFLLTQYNLQEATSFLSFYYIIFSIVLVYKNRKDTDKTVFKAIALPAAAGYLTGFLILAAVSPIWLEKGLGVFVICYSIYEWNFKKTFRLPKILFNLLGFIGGVIGGIFSSGATFFAPVVGSRVKNGVVLRATLMAIFAIANFIRFPFVVATHLLTKRIFMESLILFPVFILALYVGHAVYKYISEQLLRKLILVFLIISGVMFLVK